MDLRFLWIIAGIALILIGAVLFETGFALALIPVGLVLMSYGGAKA